MGEIYFCAFADTDKLETLRRIHSQAMEMGIFKEIFIYNELNLGVDFSNDFKDKLLFNVRGFGYWVWKPYIILESMKKIEYGDILFYSDAGSHLDSKYLYIFNEYIELVEKNDALFFTLFDGDRFIEKRWTKSDVFDYFEVLGDKKYTDTPQIEANTIFLKKTDKNIEFLEKWLDIFYNNFSLADDSPSIIENDPDFIENRHDQSILSILVKKNNMFTLPCKNIYSDISFIRIKRDKSSILKNNEKIAQHFKNEILELKLQLKEMEKMKKMFFDLIDKIVWFIPVKSLRNKFRNKLKTPK